MSIGSLREAFMQPYYGSAVDGFYYYLMANNKKFCDSTPGQYYAKFCSIVQSSGTGKSRLMTEVRTDQSFCSIPYLIGVVAS